MRVLFWNQVYLPNIGGVEILTSRLARGLLARGHEVAVVADRHRADLAETEVLDGVKIHRLPFRRALGSTGEAAAVRVRLIHAVTAAAANIKRQFAPDIVHVNMADGNGLFHLRSASAWRCATIVTLQAALDHRAEGETAIAGTLLAMADRVIAVSEASAANVVERSRIARAAIDVIYPGVPPEQFAPADAAEPPFDRTFVFLGRLVGEKGVGPLIEAVRTVPSASLIIIGDGPEGAKLKAMTEAARLADRVTFAGAVDDETRRHLLSRGLAIVVPSLHQELFGMVAVEAALAGRPAIVSGAGGLAEAVVDNVTGLHVAPGDTGALARAMQLLISDAALASRLGRAARERALRRFTVDVMVDRYERLYRRCLDQIAEGQAGAHA